MPFSFNRVLVAGNLTRDPVVKFLANEQAVASFGLAMNRKYKGRDGQLVEEATYVEVEAWGRTAELVGQYLVKGRGAFIEGRLKLDQWEKDGQKQSKLKIVADVVQFTDSKPGSGAPAAGPRGAVVDEGMDAPAAAPAPSRPAPAPAGDDEPPF
jgi:single-strand DNA-binding protein